MNNIIENLKCLNDQKKDIKRIGKAKLRNSMIEEPIKPLLSFFRLVPDYLFVS